MAASAAWQRAGMPLALVAALLLGMGPAALAQEAGQGTASSGTQDAAPAVDDGLAPSMGSPDTTEGAQDGAITLPGTDAAPDGAADAPALGSEGAADAAQAVPDQAATPAEDATPDAAPAGEATNDGPATGADDGTAAEAGDGPAVAPEAETDAALGAAGATDATGTTAATTGAGDAATATPPGDAPAAALPEAEAPARPGLAGAYDRAREFLVNGGPAIWAIAALSVVTVALILWKVWRLVLAGAWSRRTSRRAVEAWENGEPALALATVDGRKGVRSRMTLAAMRARLSLSDEAAREETSRVARRLLASQGTALRALELISTIAPLLGLLGTVMGMISAFQALQEAGSRADPSMLAGGIWEALLTTAAGMAVAIPASAALTWFEAVLDNLRADLEDLSARVFVADMPGEGMGGNIAKLAAQ